MHQKEVEQTLVLIKPDALKISVTGFLLSQLSEFHTGYRAFRRDVLESLPLHVNSDHFVFDNEMLAQIIYYGYRVGEVSCPTKYFEEASSINFPKSVAYGFGVLTTAVKFRLQKWNVVKCRIFSTKERFLDRISLKEKS